MSVNQESMSRVRNLSAMDGSDGPPVSTPKTQAEYVQDAIAHVGAARAALRNMTGATLENLFSDPNLDPAYLGCFKKLLRLGGTADSRKKDIAGDRRRSCFRIIGSAEEKEPRHSIAELAKQRRMQEEAEREAQKERARRKAAELEEKIRAAEAEKARAKEKEDAEANAKKEREEQALALIADASYRGKGTARYFLRIHDIPAYIGHVGDWTLIRARFPTDSRDSPNAEYRVPPGFHIGGKSVALADGAWDAYVDISELDEEGIQRFRAACQKRLRFASMAMKKSVGWMGEFHSTSFLELKDES